MMLPLTSQSEGYQVNKSLYNTEVCFLENASPYDTPWVVQRPLVRYFPKLTMQIAISLLCMRFLIVILKPLRQPRYVAEVFASILLGPTFFLMFRVWKIKFLDIDNIFPVKNNLVLESFANLGLTYYVFLLGLEMELSCIKHLGKKSWSIAIAGILFPFIVGVCLYLNIHIYQDPNQKQKAIGCVFWATTLTITSFSDLVRVLSDVKLLHTEIGQVAVTSTAINDISTWVFLILAIYVARDDDYNRLFTIIPMIVFVVICWFVFRPGLAWILNRTKGEDGFGDMHVYSILIGVATFGFITDACGAHSLIGGYIFGLIIPRGELVTKVMERTEDFVHAIMLPSFLVVSGLRSNIITIGASTRWIIWLVIPTIATTAKIVSTFLVCTSFGMSTWDSITLGALMNTKGIFALIVLNEARSGQFLGNASMGVMVLTTVFMTSLVEPIVLLLNTKKRSSQYKQRTVQGNKPDTQLRILTCIQAVRNISGIINILEVSNPTVRSPIIVFAVHLVELTRRASAMLIVHDAVKTTTADSPSREKAESDQIIIAFEKYKARNDNVSVHPLTAVSPYTTMHEDICNLAEDKMVNMILIAFHKQPTADGVLHGDDHIMKELNQNLLAKAPCSVGILVDRGLRSSVRSDTDSSSGKLELRFAMFFIGGPDDHEALSYAWRISGTQCVNLTVVRFRAGKDAEANLWQEDEMSEDGSWGSIIENEVRNEIDDEFINEFRFKSMCDQSINYQEKQVNNCTELVEAIRTMYNNFDLYIVGRGSGAYSPLTKELADWNDIPELGPIGETLVSSHFTAHASVLVVQQSAYGGLNARLHHQKSKFGTQEFSFSNFSS